MNLKFSNNELYPNIPTIPTPPINAVRHRIGNIYCYEDDMFDSGDNIYVILAQVDCSKVVFIVLGNDANRYTSLVEVEDLNDISVDEFIRICAQHGKFEYVGRADDILLCHLKRISDNQVQLSRWNSLLK